MVLKLNTAIEFCGKKRKFKRCPNKTLKDFQKAVEDIQDKSQPLVEADRDIQFEIDELIEESNSIDKHIQLLEKLEEPSDEEIRDCIESTATKLDIQKNIHSLRKKQTETNKESIKLLQKYNDDLIEVYGSFASLIFNNFDEDEMDEADAVDITVAQRLPELYRLSLTGASQKEMDKAFKEIIKDSFQ